MRSIHILCPGGSVFIIEFYRILLVEQPPYVEVALKT